MDRHHGVGVPRGFKVEKSLQNGQILVRCVAVSPMSFVLHSPAHWSAQLESDVRTHRIFSPNRRPLLISALLVALTSVPTLIVVAAGSASLDTAPSVRAPIVAEPRPGPLVLDPTPSSGLHSSGAPSIAAQPTAPLPPATAVRPHATAQASGGSGGGISIGTGSKAPISTPAPELQAPPVTVPVTTTPPPVVKPPKPTPSPTKDPIQNRAWPGWDGKLKGKPEAVKVHCGHRSRKGSADQSDLSDCSSSI
ncbi:hypothetical protein AB0K00_01870 [Dactylosporangium sp. NPDC049525]|uniref:hypothetical protein n=1 Tax=Dactylosporangium sp. NPDC049525 TaxID=3154730 RepID=UPI003431AD24